LTRRSKDGEDKLEIKEDSFKTYLTVSGLDDLYFDRYKCNVPSASISGGVSTHAIYRGLWIGVGDHFIHYNANPSEQFSHRTNPPRLSSKYRSLTRQLRTAIQIIREEWDEGYHDKEAGEDIQNKQFTVESFNTALEVGKKQATTASVQNMSSYLDEFKDGKLSKDDMLEILKKTVLESINQIEKKRLETIKEMFRSPQINEEQSTTTNEEEEEHELITTQEQKFRVVPGLARLGVPLQRSILQVIVRELSILSNKFPKEGILTYSTFNGVEHSLLQLPVCRTKKSFVRMDQNSKFIDAMSSSISGYCNNDEEQREAVSGWIMSRIATKNEDVFLRVANELGYKLGADRSMDEYTAQAMWDGSNTNIKSQRVIMKYIKAYFGRTINIPITVNDQKERFENENVGKYHPVDPVSNTVQIKGEHIFYWTKPLIQTLSSSISCRVYSTNDNINTYKGIHKIDLILGGDHGQRMFRMLFKVIVRKADNTKIDEFVVKIGHIDCKKDTYEVLKQTITPSLNTDIKALLSGEKKLLIFKKAMETGEFLHTVQINNYNDTDAAAPRFICPLSDSTMDTFDFVKACDIRLVVTGDLAFYAACLGKLNASGIWCSWCNLSFKE